MTAINLEFTIAEGADAEGTAALLQDRLAALEGVAAAEAVVEETRFGVVEAVALVGAAVVLVKSGRELSDELRQFVASLKGLVNEVKGLKECFVSVGGKRVPLDKISVADLQHAAG